MKLTRRGRIVVWIAFFAIVIWLYSLTDPDTPCSTATSVTWYEACR